MRTEEEYQEVLNQLDYVVTILKIISVWAKNPRPTSESTLIDIERNALQTINMVYAKGNIKGRIVPENTLVNVKDLLIESEAK